MMPRQEIRLDGGTIEFHVIDDNDSVTSDRISINGIGTVISGTGTLERVVNDGPTFIELSRFGLDPGTATSAGTLTFKTVDTNPSTIAWGNFEMYESGSVMQIFDATNFDRIEADVNESEGSRGIRFLDDNNSVLIIFESVFATNHQFTQTLFTGLVNNNSPSTPSLFPGEFGFLDITGPTPNGFDVTFEAFLTSGFSFLYNATLVYSDMVPPTFDDCPVDPVVTADCDTFYALPDYSTILNVTDNSNNLTFTQSPLAGLGAIDGTVVTVTVDDGAFQDTCTFTLNITNQTLSTNEADDIVSRNISVFPNPSKGQFTLKNTSGLNLNSAELIDVKGAKIQTIDLSGFTDVQTIDLSALNPAIYFFKIYTADGVVTKKIIIE